LATTHEYLAGAAG